MHRLWNGLLKFRTSEKFQDISGQLLKFQEFQACFTGGMLVDVVSGTIIIMSPGLQGLVELSLGIYRVHNALREQTRAWSLKGAVDFTKSVHCVKDMKNNRFIW